jgi:hypothetical protein
MVVDPTLPYVVVVPPAIEPRRAALVAAGLLSLAALPWSVPLCPTHALLGIDCPACGSTRAVHSLLTGDLVGAASHNVLLVAALPLLALWTLSRRPLVVPRWGLPALVVVLATFTVARNLAVPGLAWLDAA